MAGTVLKVVHIRGYFYLEKKIQWKRVFAPHSKPKCLPPNTCSM